VAVWRISQKSNVLHEKSDWHEDLQMPQATRPGYISVHLLKVVLVLVQHSWWDHKANVQDPTPCQLCGITDKYDPAENALQYYTFKISHLKTHISDSQLVHVHHQTNK